MALKSKNEGVRTLAFGSISGTYADVGAVTANSAWQVTISNTTDVLLIVSKDDGVTDWLRMPPSTSGVWEYLYKTENGQVAMLPNGLQFQVKDDGDAATEGEINISVEYLIA
jgi:hypothetical protein